MAPFLIALISFGLRLWDLATPKGFVFDEVYYVDGARDLLKYGVEVTKSSPEFIVHPPAGKWCIALGIKIFGNNEFGWRFAAAVAGALTIYLVGRIARKLFNSRRLAALASLLMALDGLHLVHSRTALLDLFLTLFILLAVYAWLKEHYWRSGIWFGLALGTKWSALYFLAAFALLAIYRDRHRMEPWFKLLLKRIVQFAIVPLVTYVLSWTGWFLSSRGWDRHWADSRSTSWSVIPKSFRSFWHYHAEILNFHTTLTTPHSYQANPWSWLIMGRPTSFFYEAPNTCGSDNCSQEVLALGTPLLWWLGIFALATVLGFWMRSLAFRMPDFTAGIILLGVAAGYLPWFLFQKRTVFTFYAIVFEPFIILALVYCAQKILGEPPWGKKSKILIAVLVLLIAANFIYFWPLFTGSVISYDAWHRLMWFPSWI
ncbi:MAG TPA: glycosyltransferase family 39 protein [Candidatus Paceibacterota bacterium]|nr:glycosyltransferase family 39 protein [Candidatus Paceibacterota bacterium]